MLDEKALRRADFLDGTPVTMADGQEWTLPFVDMYYNMNGDGTHQVYNMGDEYQVLMDRYDAMKDFTMPELIYQEMKIAAWLLKRNYLLNDEDVPSLVKFTYSNHRDDTRPFVVLRRTVMDIALGTAPPPKPLAVV